MSTGAEIEHARDARSRARWYVHLALLLSAAAAIVTLVYLGNNVLLHVVAGFAFVGLVVAHFGQRRVTIGRLASQFAKAHSLAKRASRQAASDTVLTFLALNVLASGVIDWLHGGLQGEQISFPLPAPFDTWHKASALALVLYLIGHVWNRRKRLRGSTIR